MVNQYKSRSRAPKGFRNTISCEKNLCVAKKGFHMPPSKPTFHTISIGSPSNFAAETP